MMTVAYISQGFPSLTTTFVYREVLALQRLGLKVRPISTWRPKRESLSNEALRLVDETFYIFPLRWPALLLAHMRYLLTRPARYLGALLRVTLLNRESLAHRLRSLGHFVYAVLAAEEVERCGAQHVHADFALNAATVAMIAAQLTGRPFSFAAHAADIFVNPVLLREKIAAARFVTPISHYNGERLMAVAGHPAAAHKMHVVHCGLDLSQFALDAERVPPARPLVLSVGRLVEKKGFRYLIEACHRLRARGYDFECAIVGGGPEEAALRALIDQFGLADRVQLTGALPQERVRELLRQATIFALPCVVGRDRDQDGIPVVLMEAMALKVPVISTRLSGIPELIRDGQNGLLVPPSDSAALADALARVLDHPTFAGTLAQAGRATIEREFNVDRSAAQLMALLQEATRSRMAFADEPIRVNGDPGYER